jgi:formylglycine-generating enzyme required for sulfatase activity
MRLERYLVAKDGRMVPSPQGVTEAIAPGSYLAVFEAPGHASLRYPFEARRDETLELRVVLPRADEIPEGYAYVPPGGFAAGSPADEQQRRDFFHAMPLHRARTRGFFIARHETTFGDWLAFLEALPRDERDAHLPRAGDGGFKGGLGLDRLDDGRWQLSYRPAGSALRAVSGEPLVYPGRERAAKQSWLRMPVVGIAVADAEAYVRWLDRSGRLAGARLCDEREWERAARGADARIYPHGMRLLPEDANHDETYGKKPDAMGPDEVGSHPASRSPFGLDDMAGNVWEWTRSPLAPSGYVARGGSFYFGKSSSRIDDREETEATFRDASVGLRVCADAPDRIAAG